MSAAMEHMRAMTPSMGNMPMNPGRHGMMAFGLGKDEHGRNIARFGKVTKNDAGETVEEKFMEKCLDPEREQIAEKSPEAAIDESDCIEVDAIEVEEAGGQIEGSEGDREKKD